MIPIEEAEQILDEIAGEFPEEFYKDLNGGILLLPDVKMHTEPRINELFILGEYHNSLTMGRYIVIYYGSYACVYGELSETALREKLRHTLRHEFTHHIESLAGEKGLEIKDAKQITDYLQRKDKRR